MILCFDVGNTDIYGGVCEQRELRMEFRRSNNQQPSADEFGLFVRQILAANCIVPSQLTAVAIASVVPGCNSMLTHACEKYLGLSPLLLRAGVKTGLKIRTANPAEVGADRIANAMAAVELHPAVDRVVIDMGTATTFCAINRNDEYLGGVIAAGIATSMRSLAQNTAKLPFVELDKPQHALGRTTIESIQSGLFLGHLGLLKEVVQQFTHEAFGGRKPLVIGTGGHSRFFVADGIFDEHVPDLVLRGLCRAVELNASSPAVVQTTSPRLAHASH